jgi:hypothetical protein
MNLNNITGKYVICSFGIDSHKLVEVVSETGAKFEFHLNNSDKNLKPYKQMKNTIVDVGTKEELTDNYHYILAQERIMKQARSNRQERIKLIRIENGSWGK